MSKKIILRSLGIFTVFIILMVFLIPGIIRKYLINHSKELIGRQMELGKLKINYFTGKILVTDFKMFEKINYFNSVI